ncbi:MAG: enoyl-CoA hydratase/isomerase family protein [Parasphingopyxis sp.]|uniref:enoyl-CoA hydratase/isomerase family protein n=1 Tax=Parasphingopyxis sp. TaxID=1920299 RepID=UPI0032EF959D
MTSTILTRTEDGVRVISYNRPERHNAIDDEMGDAFREAFASAVEDQSVRAILLRGEGKSFCSGRDVSVLGHRARDESDFDFVRRAQDGRLAIQDCPKPIVAALKGGVIGGGCEGALCADIRVADSTLKMALPEINFGLLPDTGGTQLLTALVGLGRAKYMILSGDRIDADTALSWGAVDFLVAPDELDTFALDMAKKLASKPPIALAMGKQMIDQMHGGAIRNGTRQELMAQTALFLTEDYKEARAAHREGRTPNYKGR